MVLPKNYEMVLPKNYEMVLPKYCPPKNGPPKNGPPKKFQMVLSLPCSLIPFFAPNQVVIQSRKLIHPFRELP